MASQVVWWILEEVLVFCNSKRKNQGTGCLDPSGSSSVNCVMSIHVSSYPCYLLSHAPYTYVHICARMYRALQFLWFPCNQFGTFLLESKYKTRLFFSPSFFVGVLATLHPLGSPIRYASCAACFNRITGAATAVIDFLFRFIIISFDSSSPELHTRSN